VANYSRRLIVKSGVALGALAWAGVPTRAHAAGRAVVIDLSDGEQFRGGFNDSSAPVAYIGPNGTGRSASLGVVDGALPSPRDLEAKIRAIYDELRVRPSSAPLILTDPPVDPKINRTNLATLAFERLKVPKFYVANAAVAALRASRKTTGLVCLVTGDQTYVVPVRNGKPISGGVRQGRYGGRDMTRYMQTMLKNAGTSVSLSQAQTLRDQVGEVQLDFGTGKTVSRTANSGGQVISIGAERFRCAEVMFKPNFIGRKSPGVHSLATAAIGASSRTARADLYGNVVMSGGSTMFNGIAERMEKEMTQAAPEGTKVRVLAPSNRMHSVWIGGSILSSLSTFEEMWVSRDEYDESGPGIVHRKCT
jgi:actin